MNPYEIPQHFDILIIPVRNNSIPVYFETGVDDINIRT